MSPSAQRAGVGAPAEERGRQGGLALDTARPHPAPAGAGRPLLAPHEALASAPSCPEPWLFALPEICASPCSSSSFVGPLGLPSCCWDPHPDPPQVSSEPAWCQGEGRKTGPSRPGRPWFILLLGDPGPSTREKGQELGPLPRAWSTCPSAPGESEESQRPWRSPVNAYRVGDPFRDR